MSEQKTLLGVEVKDAAKGTVEAVFATLNVVDKDGDITVKGAFDDGAPVRISAFGHTTWKGALPVGRGVIHERGDEAILEGKFFLDTDHGRNTFETLKGLEELNQWSYGYDVVEKADPDEEQKGAGAARILQKLQVHEVSPVLVGAGVDTRTLSIKEAQEAKTFADWYVASTSDISKIIHPAKSFPDEVSDVLGGVKGLITRVEGWGQDSEQKAGRVLSAANRERLQGLHSSLGEVMGHLDQLLSESDPEKSRTELMRELLRYEQLRANL